MKRLHSLEGEEWVTSAAKRNFDVAFAGLAFPFLLPLGATALGVSRILDGKGALFKQTRIGWGGQTFDLRKVRSMESLKPGRKPQGLDEEITTFGKVIRPLAVDEIPQILNVLNGTMSMVGPRAMPLPAFERMEAAVDRNLYDEWLGVYYSSRPGGISSFSVAKRRNMLTENGLMAKAKLDIDDFNNASLKHDLMLIRSITTMGVRHFFASGQAQGQLPAPTENP